MNLMVERSSGEEKLSHQPPLAPPPGEDDEEVSVVAELECESEIAGGMLKESFEKETLPPPPPGGHEEKRIEVSLEEMKTEIAVEEEVLKIDGEIRKKSSGKEIPSPPSPPPSLGFENKNGNSNGAAIFIMRSLNRWERKMEGHLFDVYKPPLPPPPPPCPFPQAPPQTTIEEKFRGTTGAIPNKRASNEKFHKLNMSFLDQTNPDVGVLLPENSSKIGALWISHIQKMTERKRNLVVMTAPLKDFSEKVILGHVKSGLGKNFRAQNDQDMNWVIKLEKKESPGPVMTLSKNPSPKRQNVKTYFPDCIVQSSLYFSNFVDLTSVSDGESIEIANHCLSEALKTDSSSNFNSLIPVFTSETGKNEIKLDQIHVKFLPEWLPFLFRHHHSAPKTQILIWISSLTWVTGNSLPPHFADFTRAVEWTQFAEFLKEQMELCSFSTTLFFVAAAGVCHYNWGRKHILLEIHLFQGEEDTCCIPEHGDYGPLISDLRVSLSFRLERVYLLIRQGSMESPQHQSLDANNVGNEECLWIVEVVTFMIQPAPKQWHGDNAVLMKNLIDSVNQLPSDLFVEDDDLVGDLLEDCDSLGIPAEEKDIRMKIMLKSAGVKLVVRSCAFIINDNGLKVQDLMIIFSSRICSNLEFDDGILNMGGVTNSDKIEIKFTLGAKTCEGVQLLRKKVDSYAAGVENSNGFEEEEYANLYKSLTQDGGKHLKRKHFSGEGQLEFKSIFQEKAAFDLFKPKEKTNNKLLVRCVFIVNNSPTEINFKIEELVKNCMELFQEIAENKEDYTKFYEVFSKNLKLRIHEDTTNKTKLAEPLRYHSTKGGDEMTSLKDYVTRMKEGQNDTSESKKYVENCQFLEKLQKKWLLLIYLASLQLHLNMRNTGAYFSLHLEDKVKVRAVGIDKPHSIVVFTKPKSINLFAAQDLVLSLFWLCGDARGNLVIYCFCRLLLVGVCCGGNGFVPGLFTPPLPGSIYMLL